MSDKKLPKWYHREVLHNRAREAIRSASKELSEAGIYVWTIREIFPGVAEHGYKRNLDCVRHHIGNMVRDGELSRQGRQHYTLN